MANKQYRFRLIPSDDGEAIYVGELLETPDGTGCDGVTIPMKLQFHLGEQDDIYIGEALEDDKDSLEVNDTVKEEDEEEYGSAIGYNENDANIGEETDYNSSRTMQSERSNVSIEPPESHHSLPILPSELSVLDEAPFRLEEVYLAGNRRPAVEIEKLPLDIRYQVYRWLFNHPEPGRGFQGIVEIPGGRSSSLQDPWIS
ncbi:hypothetical protein TWF506_010221 [Arthrobotrys conoides]|uniref:Uncharacterized protein n=1 Tax=Arthrobotrys conoides TaxID=74498 RepID=A0AAN8N6B2_9PEZI